MSRQKQLRLKRQSAGAALHSKSLSDPHSSAPRLRSCTASASEVPSIQSIPLEPPSLAEGAADSSEGGDEALHGGSVELQPGGTTSQALQQVLFLHCNARPNNMQIMTSGRLQDKPASRTSFQLKSGQELTWSFA